METIRWGILGTGRIAALFAAGLSELPDAELAAIGSRSPDAAADFAARHGASRYHASYEALATDPEIDIIYVATPHPFHYQNAHLCLTAGKAVLCEKPFTMNAGQARDLVRLARERQCFLMEAMWTRFLPALTDVRRLIADGAIGDVRFLTADFGFRKELDPSHRLFDPALGGGALLDVGVYLISLASMLMGPPGQARGMAYFGSTGVDERDALLLGYEGGRFAQLTAAITVDTPQEAVIVGEAGSIRLHTLWWKAARYTLTRNGEEPRTIDAPFQGNGYCHEAAEAMRCLRAGFSESPLMPLDETISVLDTMDALRSEWGLRYPGE